MEGSISMRKNLRRTSLLSGLAAVLLLSSFLRAQNAGPARPKITGISHVGYFISDLAQAIAFWHDFLGFEQELC
jgi:catechol-2,3-dioxygenase